MKNNKKIREMIALEELFADQLNFKLESVFSLLDVRQKNIAEIDDFMRQLRDLTTENIKLMKKYRNK